MKPKYGILIVDDDTMLAQDTKECLEHEPEIDIEADICSDSSEALSCLSKKNKYSDLVLLDIKMPKLSGAEVLQLIKKKFPDIHVIIISAYLDENNRDELIRLGAYVVFEKPCDYHKVKEYIKRAIDDIEIRDRAGIWRCRRRCPDGMCARAKPENGQLASAAVMTQPESAVPSMVTCTGLGSHRCRSQDNRPRLYPRTAIDGTSWLHSGHHGGVLSARFSLPLPYVLSFPAMPRSVARDSRAACIAAGV